MSHHWIAVKHVVMRPNVEAPMKQKNLRSPIWLILLICIAKNTQVSFFTKGHFQLTLLPFLSNALSLTLLIWCSLSLSPSPSPSSYSPLCFHLLQFHINTLTILWMASLNKLDWTNIVVSLGDHSQTIESFFWHTYKPKKAIISTTKLNLKTQNIYIKPILET